VNTIDAARRRARACAGIRPRGFVSAGALELEDPPVRLEIDAVYAGTDLGD
jgi:hypothetical protein